MESDLFAGAFEGGQRIEDGADEGLMRIGDAGFQREQALQMGVGEQQLAEGQQLRRLAQLRRYRMHEIRYQTRTAVLTLYPHPQNNHYYIKLHSTSFNSKPKLKKNILKKYENLLKIQKNSIFFSKFQI